MKYHTKTALRELDKLKHTLDNFIFSQLHVADTELNELGEGVQDYLFQADKALIKLRDKIVRAELQTEKPTI